MDVAPMSPPQVPTASSSSRASESLLETAQARVQSPCHGKGVSGCPLI